MGFSYPLICMLLRCLSSGLEVSTGKKPCLIDCLACDRLRLIIKNINMIDEMKPKQIPIIANGKLEFDFI